YPQKLFVVTAIPKSIIAITNNSILIPFIANTSVTNYDCSLTSLMQMIPYLPKQRQSLFYRKVQKLRPPRLFRRQKS
ncbi:hypothetical protein, partial [Anaerotignum faecicola]